MFWFFVERERGCEGEIAKGITRCVFSFGVLPLIFRFCEVNVLLLLLMIMLPFWPAESLETKKDLDSHPRVDCSVVFVHTGAVVSDRLQRLLLDVSTDVSASYPRFSPS